VKRARKLNGRRRKFEVVRDLADLIPFADEDSKLPGGLAADIAVLDIQERSDLAALLRRWAQLVEESADQPGDDPGEDGVAATAACIHAGSAFPLEPWLEPALYKVTQVSQGFSTPERRQAIADVYARLAAQLQASAAAARMHMGASDAHQSVSGN